MAVSAQTKENRRIAGRKAAVARKMRAGGYGVNGDKRGSAPVPKLSIAELMARIRAKAEGG